MEVDTFVELNDLTSLQKNGLKPVLKQIKAIGTLKAERQVFKLYFTDESEDMCAWLNMTPPTGEQLNIKLSKETALNPGNRRQMIEAGEGFLFTVPEAPAGADLNLTLTYVPDIQAPPDNDRYLKILETFGEYVEKPSRLGLANYKILGHLVIYEAEDADKKGTYLVVFEYGAPTNKDGGLITLYRGVGVAEHEIVKLT